MKDSRNNTEKQTLPEGRFEELDEGLMKMFRTCVERQKNGPEIREAGAKVVQALMELHRDFKPGG